MKEQLRRLVSAASLSGAFSTDLGASASTSWQHRNLFGNAEQLTLTAGVTQIDGTRAGQTGDDSSLSLNDDTLEGSASNQMLSLKWKRKGQVIANGEMMIQISDTKAYVLLLSDPADEGNQASLSCTAVSFADNAGAKP